MNVKKEKNPKNSVTDFVSQMIIIYLFILFSFFFQILRYFSFKSGFVFYTFRSTVGRKDIELRRLNYL